MDCVRVTDGNFQLGDLIYNYSDQLDAFSIYEIVQMQGKTPLFGKEVDSDRSILNDGCVLIYSVKDNFWRAKPEDRLRVEKMGYTRNPSRPGVYRTSEKRQLNVKLYYKTPSEIAKATVLSVTKTLFGLMKR